MTIAQAVILGAVQGLTEFLPVSSSGHLILVPSILGWDIQDITFDAVLHLATLAAIFVGLWPEIHKIVHGLKTPKTDPWGRLGWMIVAATLPAIVGFFFEDFIETALRQTWIVAVSLAFWGVLLILADRLMKKGGEAHVERTGLKRAMIVGCFQALALIPGTSRSGVTITAGLFAGLSRETATRFSFLLGIPAIAAGGALAVDRVEPFGLRARKVHHARGDDLQPGGLEARENLPDRVFCHRVRLDDRKGAFYRHAMIPMNCC